MKALFLIFTTLFLINTQAGKAKQSLVLNYLEDVQDCRQLNQWFYFCGSEKHLDRVLDLMSEIRRYEIGNETMNAIENSNRRLLIMHTESSVNTAGKTLAPGLSAQSNGVGLDVVVQMNFDMPAYGSHMVTGETKPFINFWALDNFFHEMSHARHKTNGTFWMAAGEAQAINDTNVFRTEQAEQKGMKPELRSERGYEDGDYQIWFGKNDPRNQKYLRTIPTV